MEKYWTSILKKLIPELSRDTCYVISLYLNVSDVYLLIETLRLPTCWPINILGVACFYDNVALLKLAMSKGHIPTQDTSNAMIFWPNNRIYTSYILKPESHVNQYLNPLQIYTPRFQKANSDVLSKYNLQTIPPDEMRHVSNLSFEEVKKLQPECVSLYFHFNHYFYDLTADDWKWIYETCKNTKYFQKFISSPISYQGSLAALESFKTGILFSDTLYSLYRSTIWDKNGNSISPLPDEEFLEFLVQRCPLSYKNNSIYNVIRNLWVFRRVHMKIKIWKRKCLEIAFENSCQETIELLHSKGLKTNKACIIKALLYGNIRALEHEKKYIECTFKPMDLLKYANHKHTIVWILDNFPIKPCTLYRNDDMLTEGLNELQYRRFKVIITNSGRL